MDDDDDDDDDVQHHVDALSDFEPSRKPIIVVQWV